MPHAVAAQQHVIEPIPAHIPAFVSALKLNRLTRNVDRITANKAKLQYECVWAPEDGGPNWLCIFGLNLYDWIGLGDRRFGSRGCMGAYMLDTGEPPTGATRATRIEASIANNDPFDPFGS